MKAAHSSPEQNVTKFTYALKQAGHQNAAIDLPAWPRHRSTAGRKLQRDCRLRGCRPKQAQQLAGQRRKKKSSDQSRTNLSTYCPGTSGKEESCISVCAAGRREENVMAALTGGARLKTGFRQIIAPASLKNVPGLASSAERKTRFSVLAPDKRAESVMQALAGPLLPCQSQVHTLTCGSGKESASHQESASTLQADRFLAHPNQAWQRGLTRQHIPKGAGSDTLDTQHLNTLMEKLNSRPRKFLGFKTPEDLSWGEHLRVALGLEFTYFLEFIQ